VVAMGTHQPHVQVAANKGKLAKRLAPDAFPLDYSTAMRVIRDAAAALSPAPVISCEGANTMDNARCDPSPSNPTACMIDCCSMNTSTSRLRNRTGSTRRLCGMPPCLHTYHALTMPSADLARWSASQRPRMPGAQNAEYDKPAVQS